MSEYVTFEIQPLNEPNRFEIITNQTLTRGEDEVYNSPQEGDEGSPLAQTLFAGIDGLLALTITHDSLIVTHDPAVPLEAVADDIRDAVRDFFL